MLKNFKTINGYGEAELVEKKSRFISYVNTVSCEEEAIEFINNIKKKNRDATHNVFAFQIGERNELIRQSDDGEPSGTAGLPVLDVLRGEDIKNAVIVVTRYFGGTLLGTGGLVRAYGKCAKLGVDSAGIIQKVLYRYINITVDYSLSGKIQYETIQKGHIIKDTIYTDKVKFVILTEAEEANNFIEHITNITSACADIFIGIESYGKWIGEKLVMD